MARHKTASTLQVSFLEALLLGIETEPTLIDPPESRSFAPEERPQPSTRSQSPDEVADLFGLISALAPTTPDARPFKTQYQARADTATEEKPIELQADNRENGEGAEQEESQPSFVPITPQWLLDHFSDLLAHISVIWNSMRECERLPSLGNAEGILAPQLVAALRGLSTDAEAEAALLGCCRDLETLAQRLYGDVTHQTKEEISRCMNVLMENALRQPYEDEELWIRRVLESAIRKVLAGQSDSNYSALVVSTLQRPFREIVRHSLQANELPFPERVLAQARENGYANTMRESLQTMARLGLTARTATLAWEAALSGQTATEPPWIARRADGSAAAILGGHAIVDQRVIRYPGYSLLAIFDAERRIMHQMTIAITALQEAKQSLWAKGYRRDDEAFPLPARVVQLWCDFCHGRDNGWWFGDEVGQVMVVMPYVMRSRLGYHKPLCRAVEQMQAWGYHFRYDGHTLYFLPAGVDMPIGKELSNK